MDQSMAELTQKIDHLSSQVAYLTEQAEIAERQRTNRAELVQDLTPIANEAFRLTVEQLEEYLAEAKSQGTDYIVALRGDPPKGTEKFEATEGGLRYANE